MKSIGPLVVRELGLLARQRLHTKVFKKILNLWYQKILCAYKYIPYVCIYIIFEYRVNTIITILKDL